MWGNLSPLLLKEGLGVVSHILLSKVMIYRMLLFTTPNPSFGRRGLRLPHIKTSG